MSHSRILLAAAALALTGAVGIQPASAQFASFCDNTVSANSYYRNINPQGQSASVATYFVQLQNRGPDRHIRVAFFSSQPGLVLGGGTHTVHRGVASAGTGDIAIKAWEQITVQLGSQRLSNPSGEGAISATDAQTGLPHFTGVTCTTPR
ncbi:MAG: hypothetical protein K5Q68_00960 [Roseococcus sp.]|nr:hypothetical protein [Roseococcus sp.]